MSTEAKKRLPPHPSVYGDPGFEKLEVTDNLVTAYLSDGRVVSIPLWWSWRLEEATPQQRKNWQIIGDGRLVEWEEIDEHLSVGSFMHGAPATRPKSKV